MPFRIQRVPRGLNELLSIFGGETPRELEDRIRGTIDLLQSYGLTQLQTATTANGAAAEGAAVIATPSSSRWTVVFAAHASFTKTATVTALRGEVFLNRAQQSSLLLASEALGPFGATETGTVSVGGPLPYPMLCPPNSFFFAQASIIGTDASCAVSCTVEFGVIQ